MNIDNLKFCEKILLINLIVEYRPECKCIHECDCGCDFSERLDRFSEKYNVSLNNVVSLFSKLKKHSFLIKERCYPEKHKAKYRYSLKHDLMDWLGDEYVLGAQEKTSDFKFFLREMENRYPNANRTISADQRWLLLILIAHQDEFGTVTHLTIKELCYLMGGIRKDRFKRIQKKSVDDGLISVLKTSATFFNEVRNVYVLKGSKGRRLKVTPAEIKLPYIPSALGLWNKILTNEQKYKRENIAHTPEQLKVTWLTYDTDLPVYIYKLLQARLPVPDGGLTLIYAKYFNKDSQDTLYLMQIKLNEMASLMLSNYWNELDISKDNSVERLTRQLCEDSVFLSFIRWDKLLAEGILKEFSWMPSDILEKQLMYAVTMRRNINLNIQFTENQKAAISLYVRTVQAMIAFSVATAHQYYNLLREYGEIKSDVYNHIVEPHDFQNLPMIKDKVVPLYSVHSYIPNTQDNEFYHLIEFNGEGKKITYKRMIIASTLIT